MKKILLTTAALATLSSSVYATKARIEALGEDAGDNYLVEDQRRIFTNAAHIHNYMNSLTFEWGEKGTALDTDSETNPQAQGGFITKCGSFACGIYLGDQSNTIRALRVVGTDINSTSFSPLRANDNTVSLFFGGGSSMKWGAALNYSSNEDKSVANEVASEEALSLNFGALTDKWEAYATVGLGNEAEFSSGFTGVSAAQKFDGDLGLRIGGNYKLSNDKEAYVTFKKIDWTSTSGTTETEGAFLSYQVGYQKDFGNAFVRAFYESIKIEFERSGVDTAEVKRNKLPVVIGYEGKANSWLTLRGSITHNLMGKVEASNLSNFLSTAGSFATNSHLQVANSYNAYASGTSYLEGEKTLANSTVVNAGASLNFGKLSLDGAIGTTGASRSGTSAADEGVLAFDNLFTRVGMHYSF